MSESARILGRGVAFPPRVGSDGRVAFSDGEQNVRESIEIVLRTELRERLALPGFGAGLTRYLFEPNTTTTRRQIQDATTRALAQWEPRVALESVTVDPDSSDPESAVVTIVYRLVATHVLERVSLNVSLAA